MRLCWSRRFGRFEWRGGGREGGSGAQNYSLVEVGGEERREVVCVEPEIVKAFDVLLPGHAFVMEQTIRPV